MEPVTVANPERADAEFEKTLKNAIVIIRIHQKITAVNER